EGNTRLQKVVSFFVPEVEKKEEEEKLATQYKRWKVAQVHAWNHDIAVKHRLQTEAIASLPQRLKEQALKPDYSPIPLNRKLLFHTPPESYRD
uniref:mL40 n=1 Tax=Polytomella magna TaxID=353565 RepID=UPI002240E3F8|nr:Chain AE, mL40 [Polytomella magna]8APN_AE Chain AE, mL40 [Polytomella magna]8APO_AE Chain AE, mL40 [Polytomella magna]